MIDQSFFSSYERRICSDQSLLILILFLFRLEHILGTSELRSDQRLFRFRLQLVLVRLFWLRVRVYLGTHRNAFMVSAASRFVSGSQEFSLLEKPFHLTKNSVFPRSFRSPSIASTTY